MLIHSRHQGVCHFSAPTVCTKLVQSRYFGSNKRFGSYSLLQNWFIHEIREYATFLLLQFVPNLFSRGIVGKINVLAPTVCFKIDSLTKSGSMPPFCSYSLYQSCSVEVFWVKERFGSYSLLQNWFIHDIREYATFLLLQFVPNLFSRGIVGKINVLAPTVCFNVDSLTKSGSMPPFCSYSLYQSCSVEVFWVKERFGSYSLFQCWFIHDIRECATFLLLQFAPNLFSRGILGKMNVLAPTVCFNVDSFTTSGSVPLFCYYSSYQTCSVEVLWVK